MRTVLLTAAKWLAVRLITPEVGAALVHALFAYLHYLASRTNNRWDNHAVRTVERLIDKERLGHQLAGWLDAELQGRPYYLPGQKGDE